MNISHRAAQAEDYAQAHQLIRELAIYENAEQEVELSLEEFIKDATASPPAFQLQVALLDEKQVIGMALYYEIYSTWKGRIVYLDDLVVTEQYRRAGVGTILLHHVIAYARERRARQVRWHVLDWNEPAIQFYQSIGAKPMDGWTGYRMSGETLLRFGS